MPADSDDELLANLVEKLNGSQSNVEWYPARHPDAVLCIFNCITTEEDADRHLNNDASRANDQLHEEGWGPLVEAQGERWQGRSGLCSLHINDDSTESRDTCTRRGNVTVYRPYAGYLEAVDKVAWFREAFIKAMTLRADALGLEVPLDAARQ